jgi:hypothetical protein
MVHISVWTRSAVVRRATLQRTDKNCLNAGLIWSTILKIATVRLCYVYLFKNLYLIRQYNKAGECITNHAADRWDDVSRRWDMRSIKRGVTRIDKPLVSHWRR